MMRRMLKIVLGAVQRGLGTDLIGYVAASDDNTLVALARSHVDHRVAELVPEFAAVPADIADHMEATEDSAGWIVAEGGDAFRGRAHGRREGEFLRFAAAHLLQGPA